LSHLLNFVYNRVPNLKFDQVLNFVGSVVMLNMYSPTMDPNLWENPREFNPMRHFHNMNESKEKSLTFSIGKILFGPKN